MNKVRRIFLKIPELRNDGVYWEMYKNLRFLIEYHKQIFKKTI